MNRLESKFVTITASILLLGFWTVSAMAQNAKLELGNLDKLASKAKETVEVSLDEKMLPTALKFLEDGDPEQAKIKELVSKLKGVYVKVFEFEKPGAYDDSDLEPIRNQLQSSGWSKIASVQSKEETVGVHVRYHEDTVMGLAILVAEPKELVIVNIVGPIDLEKLSQLGGKFGIPDLKKLGGAANPNPKPKPKLNKQ